MLYKELLIKTWFSR